MQTMAVSGERAMQHRRIRFGQPCIAIVTLALVAGFLIGTIGQPASAQTVRYFDEPLAPYGYWVDDLYYGRVWRPRETPADWRPYTYGRWVYTSEYGWVWVSEEPWGWVVYHYGRWVWTSQHGWVWIAGDVWGPSWVEWCYGGGYVGWTPMPPDPSWQGTSYYGSYDCASPRYYSRAVFVSETYFASPRVSAHVMAPSQNAMVARGAVNVTSYTRVGGAISNRSIDIAKLQAATGQPITPIRVVQAKGPVAAGAGRGPLQELRIYRPSVAAMKPPRLDDGKTPGPALDPDSKGVLLSPGPLDGGAVRAPSLDRPAESLSPPSLGGVTNPSLGVGNPGGGVLGGARGRLGR
jgi:hypothetical protein